MVLLSNFSGSHWWQKKRERLTNCSLDPDQGAYKNSTGRRPHSGGVRPALPLVFKSYLVAQIGRFERSRTYVRKFYQIVRNGLLRPSKSPICFVGWASTLGEATAHILQSSETTIHSIKLNFYLIELHLQLRGLCIQYHKLGFTILNKLPLIGWYKNTDSQYLLLEILARSINRLIFWEVLFDQYF